MSSTEAASETESSGLSGQKSDRAHRGVSDSAARVRIALGYEHLNAHDSFRHDVMMGLRKRSAIRMERIE